MKVKIRGLVFAGFAAAVFAQSALAESPTQPNATQQASDQKTVTSKWYVDGKFNGQVGYVMTQGDDRGEIDFRVLGNEASYINSTANGAGDGVPVTGKAVGEALDALQTEARNIDGDEYVSVTPVMQGEGNNAVEIGKQISVIDNNLAKTEASITDNTAATVVSGVTTVPAAQDKLVTASAVKGYAQPKVPNNNVGNVMIGVQTVSGTGNDAVYTNSWEKLQAHGGVTSTTAGQNYITMTHDTTHGVYEFNLAEDQVGTHGVDDTSVSNLYTSDVTSSSYKLATGKAVYEYAQPRFTNDSVTGSVTVGYKTSGNDSTWTSLHEETRTGKTKYVELVLDTTGGDYDINIDHNQLVGTGSAILDDNNANMLVKASAVKDLIGGNTLPEMPDECIGNANVHCALVSSYYAAGTVDPLSPTNATFTANTTRIEWTVMAQAQ